MSTCSVRPLSIGPEVNKTLILQARMAALSSFFQSSLQLEENLLSECLNLDQLLQYMAGLESSGNRLCDELSGDI